MGCCKVICLVAFVILVGLGIAIYLLFPDLHPPVSASVAPSGLQFSQTSLAVTLDVHVNVTNRNRYDIDLVSGNVALSYRGNQISSTNALPTAVFPAKQLSTYVFQFVVNVKPTDPGGAVLCNASWACLMKR